jgi:DNA-binding SARP family transcriptional activator
MRELSYAERMLYYSRERLYSREKQDMDDDNHKEGTSYFPSFRIWLCGTFRVERRVGNGYEFVRTTEWGGSSYPRLLLKALLCCPGRQVRRDALLEMLWPDAELEQAVQSLNTAVTRLRRVLTLSKGEASLLLTDDDSRVYRLAEQSLLWVDADAALTQLGEAERCGRISPEALPLLEEIETYLSKGMILQDEEGSWAAGRRATVEQARYRCRLWLAETYEQQQMPG